MKTTCTWQDKLAFQAKTEDGLEIRMDARAPLGSSSAPTPKQFVLSAICGCTGMDVISLLRKHKQIVTRFEIDADGEVFADHPMSFKNVALVYRVDGRVDAEKVKEAVVDSQTKYCAVSAMIAKEAPISYRIEINGKETFSGEAQFNR